MDLQSTIQAINLKLDDSQSLEKVLDKEIVIGVGVTRGGWPQGKIYFKKAVQVRIIQLVLLQIRLRSQSLNEKMYKSG